MRIFNFVYTSTSEDIFKSGVDDEGDNDRERYHHDRLQDAFDERLERGETQRVFEGLLRSSNDRNCIHDNRNGISPYRFEN